MTTSKEFILAAIRRNRPGAVEIPPLEHNWTTYADRRQKFIEVLQAVGGHALVAGDTADLNLQLERLPIFSNAQKIASRVPGVGTPTVDLASIDSPHELDNVDVAIMPGEFAVAENAAVWVTDKHVPLRVVYFLCQHLVLVVPASEIVDSLHVAYDRLALVSNGGRTLFAERVFGAFISGPSKTADIEQTLVIGAHGPRSLTVCLLES